MMVFPLFRDWGGSGRDLCDVGDRGALLVCHVKLALGKREGEAEAVVHVRNGERAILEREALLVMIVAEQDASVAPLVLGSFSRPPCCSLFF